MLNTTEVIISWKIANYQMAVFASQI